MKKIEVFGPGCTRCTALYNLIQSLVQEEKIQALVVKVSDPQLFAVRGVLMTPALGLNGDIVLSGRAPSRDEILALLEEHGYLNTPNATPEESNSQGNCSCNKNNGPQGDSPSCDNGNCPENNSSCSKNDCCCGGATKETGSTPWVFFIICLIAILLFIRQCNRLTNKENSPPMEDVPQQESLKQAQ